MSIALFESKYDSLRYTTIIDPMSQTRKLFLKDGAVSFQLNSQMYGYIYMYIIEKADVMADLGHV
jgi:hypothetical protein